MIVDELAAYGKLMALSKRSREELKPYWEEFKRQHGDRPLTDEAAMNKWEDQVADHMVERLSSGLETSINRGEGLLMITAALRAVARKCADRAGAFVAPKGLAQLLSMTDAEPLPMQDCKLPFEIVWLDGEFVDSETGSTHHGILATQTGLVCSAWEGEDRSYGVFWEFDAWTSKGSFVMNVMWNWLRLLDTQQVRQSHRAVSRRERDMFNRTYGGGAPSTVVMVHPVEASLLRALRELASQPGYSHAFWVRGHWKHWRAERFKQARGKRTWVVPYIKGTGKVVEKVRVHNEAR